MHGVKLAGQVLSAEMWRQERKQQDKYKATAAVRKKGKENMSSCHKDCDIVPP
jgi:hypothetical protein